MSGSAQWSDLAPRVISGVLMAGIGAVVIAVGGLLFDALISERPYKQAWSLEQAVDAINQDSGSHFDPELIRLFNQVLPDIIEIRKQYADEDQSD